MPDLVPVSFAAPWALAALFALPALWWLVRLTPPAPRRLVFPPVRLLRGLHTDERVSARTPWWLLVLRVLVACLAIVGLARPMATPAGEEVAAGLAGHPLLLVLDDGWASAADWRTRAEAARRLLEDAGHKGQPVVLLTTAATPPDAPPPPLAVRPAAAVLAEIQALEPRPWPTDRAGALSRLEAWGETSPGVARIAWIHDGLEDPVLPGRDGPLAPAEALAGALARLGPLDILAADPARPGTWLLDPPRRDGSGLDLTVRRPTGTAPATVWVRLLDGEGRVMARTEASFAPGAGQATARLDPPAADEAGSVPESALGRLDLSLAGEAPLASAGARILLTDALTPRAVGLIRREGGARGGGVPLLDPLYFVAQALAPLAEVHEGPLASLLARPLALLILPDLAPLAPSEQEALETWVRQGGTLVRFASPRAEADADPLIPVRLLGGDRQLGGALSWRQPAHLAPFPGHGPFVGLEVPPDITVSSQVLAQPEPGLEARTWALLDDGTPLITGAAHGRGRLVLFHVPPTPGWSTLPLSVLFEHLLDRLVALARHPEAEATPPTGPLPAWRLLDGFGRLGPPGPAARPLTLPSEAPPAAGPGLAPGLYGSEARARAVNLAPAQPTLVPVARWPAGIAPHPLVSPARPPDLMAPLLAAALALAILDLFLSLILRGLIPWPRRARLRVVRGPRPPATASWLGLCLGGGLVLAAGFPGLARAQAADRDLDAILQPRLAYVVTGERSVDEVSAAGLAALTEVVGRRTAATLGPPLPVDLERDDPLLFPLLYWPLEARAPMPSPAAQERLRRYARSGGLLVLDSHEGTDPTGVIESLDLAPVHPLDGAHVLARSFYLLDAFPGRVAGRAPWIAEGGDNDGVAPAVVGDADWAGAWAYAPDRGYLFAVSPGGPAQREKAFRFGVNLVIYALTGNYKGDQVHMKTILERMRR
ncbi:DUF4159 domain-containing protein [Pararhodospirillum oryzae]|uniref:Double-region n=1 Tax=Pararhodospirillum oryzae TaxID=478448 RepID=A0A512H8Z6_9PROT|nr:DUF4159 domain-containing protein [Pararhodospirillum oryzae]GEO81923.1 double-region [Pararhodospirillum oryzae]